MARGPAEPFDSEAAPGADEPSAPRAPDPEPADRLPDEPALPEVDLAALRARARGARWRLRHLMYLVAVVAVLLWLGILIGDRIVVIAALLVSSVSLLFVIVMGAGVVTARRRSTRQESLLGVLAIAAEHDMPLAPAIAAFAHQYRGRMQRRGLDLAAQLTWGTELPEALERTRGLVSRDAVLLSWVGQASGLLPKALRTAVTTRSTSLPIWTAIASRLAYILALLLAMQTIVSFILYYILPKFEAIFKDFDIRLPRITIMIVEASHAIIRYASPLILLPFAEIGLLIFIPFSFLAYGDFRIPLFDRFMRRRHTALILRSLSLVVEGNKPIVLGLSALADHYPIYLVRSKLVKAERDVRQGVDWIEALWRRGLIRATDAEVLASASAVGNLGWALAELASTTERRFLTRFQAWVQMLFPLVVVMLGMVAFVIAAGFFAPLVQLIERLTEN